MLLTEAYKQRLRMLAGLKPVIVPVMLKEAADLYANSNKRVKFDLDIMKQAIEGGMEMGMVFQSNNEKYKMPIWKMRIIQPVAMGPDKNGQIVIRGIHVEGASEKKAIETGVRSAEAKNEWRLFKASNIKSMFFTGRLFTKVALPGYNPNDSAMTSVIASFNPQRAADYQKQLKVNKKKMLAPSTLPIQKPETKPVAKAPVAPKPAPISAKSREDAKNLNDLQKKIDKLGDIS